MLDINQIGTKVAAKVAAAVQDTLMGAEVQAAFHAELEARRRAPALVK